MKLKVEYKKNRKITQSFSNAFRGLWLGIRSERNMRIHVVCAIYVLLFSYYLGLNRGEFALLFAVIGVVIAVEGLNTSIEKLCDFSCGHKDRRIGIVKDIAAGAVLITSVAAVAVGVFLLWRPEQIWELINIIFSNIYYALATLASLCLSIWFILAGPLGMKRWLRGKR